MLSFGRMDNKMKINPCHCDNSDANLNPYYEGDHPQKYYKVWCNSCKNEGRYEMYQDSAVKTWNKMYPPKKHPYPIRFDEMDDLIQRLKLAGKGTPELNLAVMKVLGLIPENSTFLPDSKGIWVSGLNLSHYEAKMITNTECQVNYASDKTGAVAWYTDSLDGTENMLPEGWGWSDMLAGNKPVHYFQGWKACVKNKNNEVVFAVHESLAIARTIAVLKAFQKDEDDKSPLKPIDVEEARRLLQEGAELAEKVRKGFEPCFQISDEELRRPLG